MQNEMTASKTFVGVVGGSVGSDPFDPRTWSGSSLRFFSELKRNNQLHRAFGTTPGPITRGLLMAKNFHLQRPVWRRSYYMDSTYRRSLTHRIATLITQQDYEHTFIQIGAMFNLPLLLNGRARCASYHDGNLACALRAGYTLAGVAANRIDAAMTWEQEVYDGMDWILTMSEYLRKSFIEDFHIPADRVTNIGAGINADDIPEDLKGKRYDTREMLFVGIEFDRKGGKQLLEAFRFVHDRWPAAKLHVVGPSHISLPACLEKAVHCHGFIDKRSPDGRVLMADLYHRCCLFVLPSLYEPMGIAPLEAMAHGLPCVLSNAWALKEIVTPGLNGELVAPGDADALGETLIQCLAMPDVLATMGSAGRSIVLREYTWERVVERFIAATRKCQMS